MAWVILPPKQPNLSTNMVSTPVRAEANALPTTNTSVSATTGMVQVASIISVVQLLSDCKLIQCLRFTAIPCLLNFGALPRGFYLYDESYKIFVWIFYLINEVSLIFRLLLLR